MASASRTEKSWSTARTLPLNSTVSASWACATPADSAWPRINSAAAPNEMGVVRGNVSPGFVLDYSRTVYGPAICSSGLSVRSAVRSPPSGRGPVHHVSRPAAQRINQIFRSIRDGIAAPDDMLVGPHQYQLPIVRLLVAYRHIDDLKGDTGTAHGIHERRDRNVRIASQQRVPRPKGIVDRPAVRQLLERHPATRRRRGREIRHRVRRLAFAVVNDDGRGIVEVTEVEAATAILLHV